ncbi:hypothetical protein B9479_007248 [Cryptococcus floricola]|uniref:DUF7082 domain-containing protein n=1 Tax=Cryptococcus floricola TaxID=2591691 RepID=A0A5D3APT2_9TREE|nr:hypothetical protein B9479_007248 [Cryptococcus floricola]
MSYSSTSRDSNKPARLYQPSEPEAGTSRATHPYYVPRSQAPINPSTIPPSPSFPLSPEMPSTAAHTSYSSPVYSSRHSFAESSQPQYGFSSSAILPPDLARVAPPPSTLVSKGSYVTIHRWGPSRGTPGSFVSVTCDVDVQNPPLNTGHPATPPPSAGGRGTRTLRLLFGNHPVQTSAQVMQPEGYRASCMLEATVPSLAAMGRSPEGTGAQAVPVTIQVLSDDAQVLETVSLGQFTYAPDSNLARKRSGEPLESTRRSPTESPFQRRPSGYISSPEIKQYDPLTSWSGASKSHNRLSDAPSRPSFQSPYSSTSTMGSSSQSNRPSSSSSSMSQPSFMRATQVIGGAPLNAANTPYVSTGQKAILNVTGDLTGVAKGWNSEEWSARRRLVQFWRRQEGTTIHAQFQVVAQAEWASIQSSIVVSCMFWEEKNACFISSVDIIYLLEALVGTHFTVEEKNRIRRNLEGFKPITVDKSKPDTAKFFKQIMNLPNPRPRNIEKNVKVYAWDCLEVALQKIISKYSASFPANQVEGMTSSGAPYRVPQPSDPASPLMKVYDPLSTSSQYSVPPSSHPGAESLYSGQARYSQLPSSRPQSSSSSTTQLLSNGDLSRPSTAGDPMGAPGQNPGPSSSRPGNSGIGLYFDMPQGYPQQQNGQYHMGSLSGNMDVPPSTPMSSAQMGGMYAMPPPHSQPPYTAAPQHQYPAPTLSQTQHMEGYPRQGDMGMFYPSFGSDGQEIPPPSSYGYLNRDGRLDK